MLRPTGCGEWPPQRLIRVGGITAAIGFGSVILANQPALLWAGYAVAAFGMGWVYPSVPALAANSVEAHEQGAAAGSVGAAQGLGIILGPLAGTAAYALDNGLPYGSLRRCCSLAPSGGADMMQARAVPVPIGMISSRHDATLRRMMWFTIVGV